MTHCDGYVSDAPSKVTLSNPPNAASSIARLAIAMFSVISVAWPSTGLRSSINGALRLYAADRICLWLRRTCPDMARI